MIETSSKDKEEPLLSRYDAINLLQQKLSQ